MNWQDVYDRAIGLRVRTAPHAAAHVASALNEALPKDRVLWTPQTLFLFVSAFAKVERHASTGAVQAFWLKQPPAIVSLLLRGTVLEDDQRDRLTTMLLDECTEVIETLPLAAIHERDVAEVATAPAADEQNEDPKNEHLSKGLFALAVVLGPLGALGALGSSATNAFAKAPLRRAKAAINQGRSHLKDQRIVEKLAKALLDGGLSTRECRDVLISQGIAPADVDDMLRKPPKSEAPRSGSSEAE